MSFSSQDVYKKALGRGGEKRVAEFLKARGLKILKTNYVTPFGEADIIAEDKALGEIAFIEVKTRSSDSYGTPAEAVGTKKREKYRKIEIGRAHVLNSSHNVISRMPSSA